MHLSLAIFFCTEKRPSTALYDEVRQPARARNGGRKETARPVGCQQGAGSF